MIKNNEKIDELNINNLKIIQSDDDFKYGTDAVLLSKFASVCNKARLLDLCTGSGIIPILLSAFSNASHITGVEYFEHIADRAQRSVKLNSLQEKIDIKCMDIKNIPEVFERDSFDHVTVNPPYKIENTGAVNINDYKKAARHEVLCNLDDVVRVAGYSLKYGGKLTMVHRAERLADIISAFRKYNIEPKRVSLVMHSLNLAPKLILIEGKKGAKSGLVFELPVFAEGGI